MADDATNDSNQEVVKEPSDWVTGDEPATAAQRSYLGTLAQQTGEEIDTDNLTKAEASEHIDRLQAERDGDGGGSPGD